MKRSDLKKGVAYATYKKEAFRFCGPFEKIYIEGDPKLSWEWGDNATPVRADKGPGVLVRYDDGNGDLILGIAKIRKIVGTFEVTIKAMMERDRKNFESLGFDYPEKDFKKMFGID